MAATLSNEEAIFYAALEIHAADQRSAYLDAACANQAELRQRIEALLRRHEEAAGPLDRPGLELPATCGETVTERPGTVIGPYKLLQQIGEGGMGTVFMADQTHPVQRKVALKLIKAGMDSRQVIARFEAERQALAMMDHVNIARVLDAGATESGRPYFVMELVHGVPITKYCDDNRLTPRERLELFLPVCQAIQHAHQKGIIHRDIKPSNVMVTLYDGKAVPKVIDFGVAKATEQKLTERTLFTQYGTMVGTLEYMSPEQAEMSALGVDTRSDIYSLGVLLYELLTGSTPLTHKRLKQAAYAEILHMIKEEEPPKPSTRLSTTEGLASISAQRHMEPAKLTKLVRGELDWIAMKCLEKDRNRRYATANGLARDIERYLHDEPVQACPPSAMYRLRKLARRNKRALAVAISAFVLLVLAVLALAVSNRHIREEQKKTEAARQGEADERWRAEQSLEKALRAEREKTVELGKAKLAQAEAGRWSGRAGRVFDSLQALTEAAQIARSSNAPDDHLLKLRNEAIACLALTDLRVIKEWERYTPGSAGAALDTRLNRYATSDDQGNISLRRMADDGEIIRLSGPGIGVRSVAFSPDGEFLEATYPFEPQSQRGRILIWDLRRGERAWQLAPKFDYPVVVWSPDSRRFAVHGQAGTVTVYDVFSQKELQRFSAGVMPHQIAFHPAARQLAVLASGAVQIRDVETGKLMDQFAFPVPVARLSWGADGRFLAGAYAWDLLLPEYRHVYVWDVPAGRMHTLLKGHMNTVVDVAFNHAGDLLASTSWDGTLRLWNPWTGKELLKLEESVWGQPLEFSLDDRFLLISNGNAWRRCWEVKAAREFRTLNIPAGGFSWASFTPDGRLLVSGFKIGTQPSPPMSSFSPDGRLLASADDDDGMRLWDVAAAKHIGLIGPGEGTCRFEPNRRSLLTAGHSGLHRWPFSLEQDEVGRKLRIGPPEKVALANPLALSRDERALAAAQQGRVLSPDGQWVASGSVRFAAAARQGGFLSAGGQWVASGMRGGSGAKVWDAQSGKLARHLTTDDTVSVGFGPDGKWLVTGSETEYQFWEVSSWKTGLRIPRKRGYLSGIMAFSPDGKLLAIKNSTWDVQLIDPGTGRHLATLPNPDFQNIEFLAFGPDGSQLAVGRGAHEIHLVDLRAIRRRLAEMGVDWNLPAYPPPSNTEGSQPLQVQLDLGEFVDRAKYSLVIAFFPFHAQAYYQRSVAHARFGQWPEALADFNIAVALQPGDARAFYGDMAKAIDLNGVTVRDCYTHAILRLAVGDSGGYREICANLLERLATFSDQDPDIVGYWSAWTCVLAPNAVADPAQPVQAAEKALAVHPKNNYQLTALGAALYRAGRFDEAVQRLNEASAYEGEGLSMRYTWFFLAMAHHRLGNASQARQWLDKAVQALDQATAWPPVSEWKQLQTLQLLRREAETLVNGSAADQQKRKEKENSHSTAPGR